MGMDWGTLMGTMPGNEQEVLDGICEQQLYFARSFSWLSFHIGDE
jgi:hypothetical protein